MRWSTISARFLSSSSPGRSPLRASAAPVQRTTALVLQSWSEFCISSALRDPLLASHMLFHLHHRSAVLNRVVPRFPCSFVGDRTHTFKISLLVDREVIHLEARGQSYVELEHHSGRAVPQEHSPDDAHPMIPHRKTCSIALIMISASLVPLNCWGPLLCCGSATARGSYNAVLLIPQLAAHHSL